MNYSDQVDQRCDLNGNFFAAEDPKSSVLQILTETLRRNPPPPVTPEINVNSTSHSHLSDKDYTSVDIVTERETNSEDSDSNLSFNPGDKLSSPVPPLASQTPLQANDESNEPRASQSYTTTQPKISLRTQFRQCHLATVLGSARRCFKQLSSVKEGLAVLVSKDEQLSQGKKIPIGGPDYGLIATLGEYILFLTRQAFTPAHRLYTASLGLHLSEDLIRNPHDPTLLNFSAGYIQRPSWNSIIHTQMKLRSCVDSAIEMYHRFGRDGTSSSNKATHQQMQHILVTLMHAFQDLYATALGSTDIFKVLLHIEDYGEKILQEFLLSLESLERSDLLLQVQALRRSFDDIVIMMEQLSWAAYIVYRLAIGKSLTPSPDGSTCKIPTPENILPKSRSSLNRMESTNKIVFSTSKTSTTPPVSKPRSRESRDRDKESHDKDREHRSSRSTSQPKSSPSSSSGKYSEGYSHQLVRSQSRQKQSDKNGERKSKKESERHAKSFIPTPTTSTSRSRKSSPNSTRPSTPESNSYSRHHQIQSNSGKSPSSSQQGYGHRSREEKRASSSDHKSRKSKSKSRSSSRDSRSSKDKLGSENFSERHSSRIPSQPNSTVRSKDRKEKERSSSHKRSKTHDGDDDRVRRKYGTKS